MTPLLDRASERYYCHSPRLRLAQVLAQCGWEQVERPEDADVVIAGSRHRIPEPPPRADQLVDVVPGSEVLTNKGRLARLLRAHQLADVLQPETYLIDDDPSEIERLRERAKAEPDAVWIRKPLARGRGIGVEPIADVRAWLDTRSGPGADGEELVQRYILNPLLLGGTKSEVRSYILIASTDPLLVLYHDGTVRLTSQPFVRGDWSNPLVHVTNTYRQKHADPEAWETRGPELKWSLADLGHDVHARALTTDPDWVDTTLRPALIEIVGALSRLLVPSLPRRRGAFQLLGMDTILTDDLEELWLTEVQLGPGLSVDNPIKAGLIPAMVGEAAAIVLEVRDRLRRGDDPRALTSRRSFQWAHVEPPAPGKSGREL